MNIRDVIIRPVEPEDPLEIWPIWLQWQSSEKAVPFYESFGLKGDPCPDPDYPFFEIEFDSRKDEMD